jgi:leader peptidase (prepilin peptidase) / N-methyltransferase
MIDALAWTIVFVVLAGILGTIIGSFLNVVVYRVPAGLSIVSPPSACPRCGAGIRPWDNIPVVSWFVLRGRCRDCSEPISPRYPLVEAATGLLFAAVALWLAPVIGAAFVGGSLAPVVASLTELLAFLYLASISVALFLIDLDTRRLPNVIVVPGYVVGAVLLGVTALLRADGGSALTAAIGAASAFAFYFLLAVVRPGGMGFGDVKLAGVLGLFLGWIGVGTLIVGLFSAFLLGGLLSIALVVIKKAGRRTAVTFGPLMLVGAWIGVFFGETIASAYLALIGLT